MLGAPGAVGPTNVVYRVDRPQRGDRGGRAGPDDRVPFPVPGDRPVGGLGRLPLPGRLVGMGVVPVSWHSGMPGITALTELLDDAALFSSEHQLHLAGVVGEHSFSVDTAGSRFEFVGERTFACERFHLPGTAAPGPGSWMWAWANPSGFPEEFTRLSAGIRAHGERLGVLEPADAEVPFDAMPDARGDPNPVAFRTTEAAKVLSGHWTSYVADAGAGASPASSGTPSSGRPPPTRRGPQGLTELPLSDHRRAPSAYAARRGPGQQAGPDGGGPVLTGPGFAVTAAFDDEGRVSEANFTGGSGQAPPGLRPMV